MPLYEHLAMSGNILVVTIGMWSVQAKDAAKHPTIPGSPTTRTTVQMSIVPMLETLTFKNLSQD